MSGRGIASAGRGGGGRGFGGGGRGGMKRPYGGGGGKSGWGKGGGSSRSKAPRIDTPASRLGREIIGCCRTNDFGGAMAKYRAAKGEDGFSPDAAVCSSLLALCSGVAKRPRDAPTGTPWSAEAAAATPVGEGDAESEGAKGAAPAEAGADGADDDEAEEAAEEADKAAAGAPSDEAAEAADKEASAPSEAAAAAEDSGAKREAAMEIFADMKEHRLDVCEATFTMLIRVCCVDDAPGAGYALLPDMKARNLKLKLRTYAPLLHRRCARGDLVEALDLKDECAAEGVELTEAEHVALARCRAAAPWVEDARADGILDDFAAEVHAPSKGCWPACAAMLAATKGWESAVEGASVGADGTCGSCGNRLRSIDLSDDEISGMLAQIETLVPAIDAKFEGRASESEQAALVGRRKTQWATYKAWLARQDDARYDCVIDGANVGYHNQNYAGAADVVDFKQIDLVVKHCIGTLGRRALLVLHARHLADDRLPPAARPIVRAWREAKCLYSCGLRNNDDWYWLYAAVRGGAGTLLVSNDEMRDHHFGMLSARAFLVWKERHLTKFGLGAWRRDGSREVTIDAPPAFSLRSQRDTDGKHWHFPVFPKPPPKDAGDRGKYGPSDRGSRAGPGARGAPTVVVKRPAIADVAWLCACGKK